MKLVKFLDRESTKLVSDPTNLEILNELVRYERSISELAAKLNVPNLKMWRRMQKLFKAGLVEQTRTEKVGNIEKKLYRATATWFAPHQYFDFSPKDPSLKAAYEIYSDIQKQSIAEIQAFGDVPKDADPIDFSLFANMYAFMKVCGNPALQAKVAELKRRLTAYRARIDRLEIKSA